MVKILILVAAAIVISISACYVVNRICSTIENSGSARSSEHVELKKDHEAISKTINETKSIAEENNRMLSFLYNMAKGNNSELKAE